MTWKYPSDQVKYVSVSYPGPGNPWALASDGSDELISIVLSAFHPKSTLILLPIFHLPKGELWSPCPLLSVEVLAWLYSTMSLSNNHALPIAISFYLIVTADNKKFSILVLLVYVNLFVSKIDTFLDLFPPHGVFNDLHFSSRLWIQVRKSFLVPFNIFAFVLLNCCAHINCFTCNFFNCFAHVWHNCFVRIWYNCFACYYTLIWLIFVKRGLIKFLTIFLSPILLPLWVYTITIDIDVRNSIGMCSILFQIRCRTFGLFTTVINIFVHVLVYNIYLFYLTFVHFRNIFHLIFGSLLRCACMFIGWSAEYFTAFIYLKISTPYYFFLLRCAWSIFFNTLQNGSLFIFNRAHSHFIVGSNYSNCIALLKCLIVLLMCTIGF